MTMDDEVRELTEFDSLICDSRTQILKALIPFMSTREQQFLSIYVKFIEFSRTIELVKKTGSGSMSICSIGKSMRERNTPYNSNDILQAIKKQCSQKERNTIDSIMNMLNIYNTFKMYSETMKEQTSNEDHVNELFKTMLSPEQQEMFEAYSSILSS